MKTLLTIMKDLIKQQFKLTIKNLRNGKSDTFLSETTNQLIKTVNLFTLKDGMRFNKDFEITMDFRTKVEAIKFITQTLESDTLYVDLRDKIDDMIREQIERNHTHDHDNIDFSMKWRDDEEINYNYTVDKTTFADTYEDWQDINYEIKHSDEAVELISTEATYLNDVQIGFEYVEEFKNFLMSAPSQNDLIEDFKLRIKE